MTLKWWSFRVCFSPFFAFFISCVYFIYSQGDGRLLPWIFHAGLDDRRDTLHFTHIRWWFAWLWPPLLPRILCPPHRVASPRWMDGPLLFVHQNNKFDFLIIIRRVHFIPTQWLMRTKRYYKCVNERTNRSRNVRVHLLLPRRVFKCSTHTDHRLFRKAIRKKRDVEWIADSVG